MKFNQPEDAQANATAMDARSIDSVGSFQGARRPMERGRTAVWQARLILLAMINLAQLWILSAAVEAALAREFNQLFPLVIASGVCWLIAFTIFLWWKPASRRTTSTSCLREK